ncbi:2-phosphosulfolactate phosphatase [Alicyclobacillus pomorum]|uniref:2-phosphosulfolactate phosphatase n=1 Tax=Alicyclobacillus pomorum TaxID=204470 RepID=UPI0003F64702|nr:2-phosphosulfolactate phosphatase [Alicyclobacillus pomorum]
MKKIRVWATKEEIDAAVLTEATVVVMDVLLATTTMVTMVENGAKCVFPVADVQEARWLKQFLAPESSLFGGEEEGTPIPDFDCGPFPHEFSPDRVTGKDVVFVTTNGTRAVRRAESARELLIANLRNAPSVAQYLENTASEEVYLICAGSHGHLSLEDMLCAGVILSHLDLEGVSLNDAARVARYGLAHAETDMLQWIQQGRVGRWFMKNGKEHVLRFVADVGASQTLVSVVNRQLRRMERR